MCGCVGAAAVKQSGLPIKVIAARLGIEVVTVDKHLMRARRLLAEYLNEVDAGGVTKRNGSSSEEVDEESREQSRD